MTDAKLKNLMRKVVPKSIRGFRKKINFYSSYYFPGIKKSYMASDFPKIVQIQTSSICNGGCTICPYPYVEKDLSHGVMDDDTFKKIVDECSKHDVHRIIPFLMNEPLADPKLIERIRYIKGKNPEAHVSISTNGSFLTKKKAEELVNSGVDSVGFSFQGITKGEYEGIMKGLNYDETLAKIEYFLSLPRPKGMEVIINQVVKNSSLEDINNFWRGKNVDTVYVGTYISRAGFLGAKKDRVSKLRGCFDDDRPMKQISFLYNGDAILCCMDWRREVFLGNVKERSIEEIWNSPKYEKIRNVIYNNDAIGENFICKRCEMAIRPPPLDKMVNFRK